ncbi:MAG: hypothetical protein ACXADO_07245 [Candidatus Thorarchaeota archaeon]
MTQESSVGRHRIVAVLILIFGPISAALLWPYVAIIETARVEFYVIAAGGLILLFVVWAWKEYPPFPYYPAF